ncbi:hypothetical protein [Flammeovirga aprica]|uniref:Acyloxyacyl hydrolase n=1 Tax=Flammeovirga aprica JL-4 TaxID=694437 RepID=A0A7X9XCZ0_9BACT|nr:hypothetical protein [Flammeovirga aprica]NME72341.1 hypothetical protein [Flammeovirga aprica JL-4]
MMERKILITLLLSLFSIVTFAQSPHSLSVSVGGSQTINKEAYSFILSTSHSYQMNSLWTVITTYVNDIEKDFSGGEVEQINYTGSLSFGFSRKFYEGSKSEVYLGMTKDIVENQKILLGDSFFDVGYSFILSRKICPKLGYSHNLNKGTDSINFGLSITIF